MMKKIVSVLLILCMSAAIFAPAGTAKAAAGEQGETITITDNAGVEVTVPAEVDAYVDSWFAHNAISVMLDNAERMKVTCCAPETYQWMYLVSENMSNAAFTEFSDSMNLEEIIAKDPDVVFGSNEAYREMFEKVGIPFVNCMFSDYDQLSQGIRITGEILGKQEKAEKYIDYLNGNIALVEERLQGVADEDRPSILHINSVESMLVDGSNTIIDQWIGLSGGKNAAAEIDGNKTEVTMEQILAWDPDIIIAQEPEDLQTIVLDPTWGALRAVKEGRVYQNPKGVFLWDRYGVEAALQILWSAKLLYPDQFEDIDMIEEVKKFYNDFFSYEPTDEEAQKIINHENP